LEFFLAIDGARVSDEEGKLETRKQKLEREEIENAGAESNQCKEVGEGTAI
jgi:hypothetical protein